MGSIRRLLVVSYYFHPTPSVGSVRMGGLARYLPEFGWQATVVTPRREDRRPVPDWISETDDADLAAGVKRLLGVRPDAALKDAVSGASAPSVGIGFRARVIDWVKSVVAVPDVNRGWIRIAGRAGERAIAGHDFDAILTSSPPPSVHRVGHRLAKSSGLPWIADLRDLWSQDHNSTAPGWRRRIDRAIERSTFRAASALVTVSQPLADDLQQLHPKVPVSTILNGFDPEQTGPEKPSPDRFTLTHTGTFYQGRRDPTLLFKTVARLIDRGDVPADAIRIKLFARHEPWVAQLAERHGIAHVVELLPWSSRDQSLKAQRESQLLLLLHWGGDRERGVYTGKIFEYLAARRPIVMIGGGDGVLKDLIEETSSGVHVTDQPTLESALLNAWQEFTRHGVVPWNGRDDLIDRFSHRRMAREFAQLLDRVVDGG